ncbi:sporulation integral membrane protein YlbJ [Candidatus Desulforudis audaxviator]|uniref:Nucleoside recognition domain protein n=1 Tax=Desulforudis audaxviator (strain MP104C) TaxID=477974 RepID=B1I2E6_DESAP|nr:sporulation integral membrane protein YlbJ [Candidatus Desulforudis audaxviator]ACA59169.1 nucleoside recognition domain protein [Candidatus Desulforudis audaxviator MP104C]AZK59238.1 membrane protein [Candidatus Desulforudis audaxviator]
MRPGCGRILPASLTLALIVILAVRPRTAFEGALVGMDTWWNIVFPALLPFFVVSELVLGLGLAGFVGVLLEPVMRPIFALPGSASFAVAVGYSSGYPVGANFTARLRSAGQCTRAEAEHLLSFTNNASPLFILVAVAVGMFNNPALGPFLLGIHYLANLTLGLVFRRYRPQERGQFSGSVHHLWRRAVHEFMTADGRHPGLILGEAVKTAVAKLLVIGGFIVLFAVTIHLLDSFGLLSVLAGLFGLLLQPLGFHSGLNLPLATGFFEMTLGIRAVSETAAPLVQQLIAVQLILAWSGLSIQAQVASFVSHTDIRLRLYVMGRIAHAVLAVVLTLLLFPVFEPLLVTPVVAAPGLELAWTAVFQTSILLALCLPLALLSLAMFVHLLRRLLHVF